MVFAPAASQMEGDLYAWFILICTIATLVAIFLSLYLDKRKEKRNKQNK